MKGDAAHATLMRAAPMRAASVYAVTRRAASAAYGTPASSGSAAR
jgi:hypothetical protein